MSSIKAIILLWVALLLATQTLFAQKDSINIKNDSLNESILDSYNKKLTEIEKQHIADSIKKAELQTRINSLKTADSLKKEALQKKIQDLNDKDDLRIAQKKAQIDSLRHTAKGAPVTGFVGDTLFLIYNKSGSFSAKDRADAISSRRFRFARAHYPR